jgi:hypothetical protein
MAADVVGTHIDVDAGDELVLSNEEGKLKFARARRSA